MSIRDNTAGPGRLASVAWTPFDGTGLTPQDADLVQNQATASRTVADALLAAANCAFNLGWSSFALSDLADFGLLSALPTGEDSAQAWAAFVGQCLGVDLSASQPDSLTAWRRMAGDLQHHAALQTSRLSPSGGADGGGGVTHANGLWYANGQALSLLDLFTAVRVNRLANYDDSIDGYVGEIKENQRLLTAAREWASVLRSKKPAQSNVKVVLDQSTVDAFRNQWGIDPLQTITTKAVVGSGQIRDTWDAWLTELKSFIDKTDTENQTLQGQIDQKSNRRGEVIEAISGFASKQSKTSSKFASNLG